MEKSVPEQGGTPYFPSGLHEGSDDPRRIGIMENIEALLSEHHYPQAVDLAGTIEMGMTSRMRAIAEMHRIHAINARRNADGAAVVRETTHMRRALAAVNLPFRDPIDEYHERCRANGQKLMPLYESKK